MEIFKGVVQKQLLVSSPSTRLKSTTHVLPNKFSQKFVPEHHFASGVKWRKSSIFASFRIFRLPAGIAKWTFGLAFFK